MKTRIVLVFLPLFLISCVNAQKESKSDFTQLEWLIGKWERQDVKPGQSAFELWERDPAGRFSGIGATLKGIDTVFIEKLSLVEKDGSMYFVADVAHNPAPVYFKITQNSERGFACENPDHDFPKKIEYLKEGSALTVVISDAEKKIPFSFKKLE